MCFVSRLRRDNLYWIRSLVLCWWWWWCVCVGVSKEEKKMIMRHDKRGFCYMAQKLLNGCY